MAWFRRFRLSRPLLPIVHVSLQNRGKSPLNLFMSQHTHVVTPSSPKARVICPCWTCFSSTSSKLTCFKRCPLLSSSHFISFSVWLVNFFSYLVPTFLQLCFEKALILLSVCVEPTISEFSRYSILQPLCRVIRKPSSRIVVLLPLQNHRLQQGPQTSSHGRAPSGVPSFP